MVSLLSQGQLDFIVKQKGPVSSRVRGFFSKKKEERCTPKEALLMKMCAQNLSPFQRHNDDPEDHKTSGNHETLQYEAVQPNGATEGTRDNMVFV
jgi:hypothetical protein